MNRIDFLNTGGFPFELDDLNFMRESLEQFKELAYAIAGTNPVIIKGCEVVGSNANPGIMIIDGEVVPFVGGAIGTKVNVIETITPKTFEDGVSRAVYTERVAQFSLTGTLWTDFKRVLELINVKSVPTGVIMMWSGSIVSIPTGYLLCDGTSGTPDLRSRFVVGYDSAVTEYNAPGKIGGLKEVTLTHQQSGVAEHQHAQAPSGGSGGSGVGGSGSYNGLITGNVNGGPKDASQAHENRPPFYVLAFIMKS